MKKNLLQLTWPLFIEGLLFFLLGFTDTLMLSKYSDEAIGAVGLSVSIINFFNILFLIVASGTLILISQYIGAKKNNHAKNISIISINMNIIFGIILSLIIVIFKEQLLSIINTPSDLHNYAYQYLSIVGGYIFISALQPVYVSILRAYGKTKESMIISVSTNIINIIGNATVLFGLFGFPQLGVIGVAYSTVISRAIGIMIFHLTIKYKLKIHYSILKLLYMPTDYVIKILRIGIPSGLELFFYNGMQIIILIFTSQMGSLAVITRTYTLSLSFFFFLFSTSVSQANQILVGYYIGDKNFTKAYTQTNNTLKYASYVSITIVIISALFGKYLFELFTNNKYIIILGSKLLWITILLELGRAKNIVYTFALKATGDVNYPVIIGIISMWGLCLPLSYLLGIYLSLGLIGIWLALAFDELFRSIMFNLRWESKKWKGKSFVNKMTHEKNIKFNIFNK